MVRPLVPLPAPITTRDPRSVPGGAVMFSFEVPANAGSVNVIEAVGLVVVFVLGLGMW